MKKRLLSLLLVLVTLCSITVGTAGVTAQAANDSKLEIYINDEKLVYDEETYGYAYITPAPSRTMIPVRIISETLGLKVEWDNATKTAIVYGPLGKVEMQNGNYYLLLNGAKRTSDQPVVEIKNGRTFVALRVFLNALGISDDDIGWRPGVITINHSIGSGATQESGEKYSGMIRADQYDPMALADTLNEKLADCLNWTPNHLSSIEGNPMGVSTADPIMEGAVGFTFHDSYVMDGLIKMGIPDPDNGDEWTGTYLTIIGFDTEMMMGCMFGEAKALESEIPANSYCHPDDHAMLYALNNMLKELVCDEARELIVRGIRDNCMRYSAINMEEAPKGWKGDTYQIWEDWWASNMANTAFQVTDDIFVCFSDTSRIEVFDMEYYNSNIALGYSINVASPSKFPWLDSSNASYRTPNSIR